MNGLVLVWSSRSWIIIIYLKAVLNLYQLEKENIFFVCITYGIVNTCILFCTWSTAVM